MKEAESSMREACSEQSRGERVRETIEIIAGDEKF